MARIKKELSEAIQAAALRHLEPADARKFILYIDERLLKKGLWLGPEHAHVEVEWADSVLVFVDKKPTAGFGHDCLYLIFDPRTLELRKAYEAQFPPYVRTWPRTYVRFGPRLELKRHVAPPGPGVVTPRMPQGDVEVRKPPGLQHLNGLGGRKLAVFFAGVPDPSSLNTMEFGFRILTGHLGYEPADIRVANHLGPGLPGDPMHRLPACPPWELPQDIPDWPGDLTPFRMRVDHVGTPEGFHEALKALNPRPQDSLFIFTTGHGARKGTRSYLSTVIGPAFSTSMFKNELDQLRVRELIVVMQQCYGGGFRNAVKTCSAAPRIAFASAAAADTEANNDRDNDSIFAWNSFGRDWFGAQYGRYPDKSLLTSDPDAPPAGNADAHISASEAFVYARDTSFRHPCDDPQEAYRALPASRDLRLDGSL